MQIQRIYSKIQTTGDIQEQETQIQTSKNTCVFWNRNHWTDENSSRTTGKRKAGNRKERADELKNHIV